MYRNTLRKPKEKIFAFFEIFYPSKGCDSLEEFLKIIENQPQLMLNLMQRMAERIQDYETKIRSNIETASERVYSELERLQQKRRRSFVGKIIPLQITHEKLAEHTNLNRVTVTRSLKRLKDEGLITIDAKGIIELSK